MGIIALDLGLRGATAALFLMAVLVILVRARPLDAIKLLAAAMAASGAAYTIATAPFVPKSTLWWTLPILAGNPVVVWLWARATFDDDFVVRRWHGALWLIVVCIGFAVSLGWTAWPSLARTGGRLLSLVAVILALSAIAQTVRTWSADLVAGRRRLRLAIVVIGAVHLPSRRLRPDVDLICECRHFREPSQLDWSVALGGHGQLEPVLSTAGHARDHCDGDQSIQRHHQHRPNRASCRWRSGFGCTRLVAPARPSDVR
jgi:hypothetical protein